MKCSNCNQLEAVLYFGDDFVCDDCGSEYEKCVKCDTFMPKSDMQKAVREFIHGHEERVVYICDNCRCGV